MAKVIICSRHFPKDHLRAGEETHFIPKIWLSFIRDGVISVGEIGDRYHKIFPEEVAKIWDLEIEPKHHTMRSGYNFQRGDDISLRVWSGKPRRSKQISFMPVIKVQHAIPFDLRRNNYFGEEHSLIKTNHKGDLITQDLIEVAKNDGLTLDEFNSWFKTGTKGLIIQWSKQILYTR
jgi:hypothetical protein